MQLLLIAVLKPMQVLMLDLRRRDLSCLDELFAGLGDEMVSDWFGFHAIQRMRSPFLLLLLEVSGQVVGDCFFLSLAENHRQVLNLVSACIQLLGVYLLSFLRAEV